LPVLQKKLNEKRLLKLIRRKLYKSFLSLFACFFMIFMHSTSFKNIAMADGGNDDFEIIGLTSFHVKSGSGLKTIAERFNSSDEIDNITEIILDNDIDISQLTGFQKIGTDSRPFNLVFDGNNKTITINDVCTDSDECLNAIFGKLGPNAQVKNLIVSAQNTEGELKDYSVTYGTSSESDSDSDSESDYESVDYQGSDSNKSKSTEDQKTVKEKETIDGKEYTHYTDGTVETEAQAGKLTFNVGDSKTSQTVKVEANIPDNVFTAGTKLQVSVVPASTEKTAEQKAKEQKIAKNLDDKQKKLLDDGKLMLFSLDALLPSGDYQTELSEPIKVTVQIDENMAKNLKVVCISGDKVEEIESRAFQDSGAWFAELTLEHLSDYAMYNKDDEEKLESDETTTITNSHPDWGDYRSINGIPHWVDGDGKTSVEITKNGPIWLQETSDRSSAWYRLDNSKGVFEIGSRFWVRWLSSSDPEWKEYFDKLDDEHKALANSGKLWIFLVGVTAPDGTEYTNFRESVSLSIQLGTDWEEQDFEGLSDTYAVFIADGSDEKLKVDFEYMTSPDGKRSRYAIVTLKHFSPYGIIDPDESNIQNFSTTDTIGSASKNNATEASSNTKTGETNCIQFMIASILMSSLLVFTLTRKKTN